MKKLRLFLSMAAVCLALSLSSFTTIKKVNIVTKHYTLTDDSGIMDGTKYSNGAGTGCSSGNLPCTIKYDQDIYHTTQDYLNAEGSAGQVVLDAFATKP